MSGEEEKQAEAAGDETAQFPKDADYCVHVFIEKSKEIKTAAGDTVDPMFVIECLGLKEYSTAKDDIGGLSEIVWGEHIFLEPRGVDKRDAESGKITIRLMDKGLFKDALIGLYEFDLSYIYLKDKHVLEHKWLALNNPGADNFAEICGYVKVSISVAATGDEQVQIVEDTAMIEDTDVLMSPSLNPTFYQIKLRIFQGQDLPPMDAGVLAKPKIDAYVACKFKKKPYKTKTVTQNKGGKPVDWNTEFWLPAQIPVLEPTINLKLMDYDVAGENETAGTVQLKTKDLLEKEHNHGLFSWKNFYGSPLNQSASEHKTCMNAHPDLASNWKGRVLIQTVIEQTDKPIHKTMPIEDDTLMEAGKHLNNREFAVIAQVG